MVSGREDDGDEGNGGESDGGERGGRERGGREDVGREGGGKRRELSYSGRKKKVIPKVGVVICRGKRLDGDSGKGVDGGDMDGSDNDGDDVLYEGGLRRRLMSSSPSLSSSTSQHLFLVCLAGDETGGGVLSEC